MNPYDRGIPPPLPDDAPPDRRARWEADYGELATGMVSLEAFTRLTFPAYQCKWFHRRICEAMDRLHTGEWPRVMIFAPPRHGKSELTSRRLPAYALGKNPDWKLMFWANTHELAKAMTRDTQQIMDHPTYHKWFPDSRLLQRGEKYKGRRPKRTANYFELVGRDGQYRSSGVKGAVQGFGFDLGGIDDALATVQDAMSSVIRQRVWDEYTGGFHTRQLPRARILITNTRWHVDDLCGRLIREMKNSPGADQWMILEFAAVRETKGGLLVPSERVTA